MDEKIQLFGRVFIKSEILAQTGLHIGGSSAGMEIGGVDNAVIRDPLSRRPYIPGSSLRGKMRSQLEKRLGLAQNTSVGQVKMHTCRKSADYNANGGCPVCHIFGVPGEVGETGPTLLLVRDALLTDQSADALNKAQTDLAYTELKTEATIDRVTSAATPRSIERVPAGAVFGPAELVFSVYSTKDIDRLAYVLEAMQLVEDDYLGGYGSRGSGKVAFKNIEVFARSSKDYLADPLKFKDGQSLDLPALLQSKTELLDWVKSSILVE